MPSVLAGPSPSSTVARISGFVQTARSNSARHTVSKRISYAPYRIWTSAASTTVAVLAAAMAASAGSNDGRRLSRMRNCCDIGSWGCGLPRRLDCRDGESGASAGRCARTLG
jgi:hypothetical protein